MSTDVLPSPETASSTTSTPLSGGLELPPGLCVARTRHLVLSHCSLIQQRRAHDACPATGLYSPMLPFGSPSKAVVTATGSWSATKPAEGIVKTSGVSACPIMVLLVSFSCCGLGPWFWVALPAAGWSGAGGILGRRSAPAALPSQGCSAPAAQPGPRARARPVRPSCRRRVAGLSRGRSRAPAERAAGSGLARQRWPGARRGRPAGFAR